MEKQPTQNIVLTENGAVFEDGTSAAVDIDLLLQKAQTNSHFQQILLPVAPSVASLKHTVLNSLKK